MKSPSLKTVKRLFAVSRNLCGFPSCGIPLVEVSGTITGEIAHIRASSPNGPRYDSAQSDEDRNGCGNLILLCSRHHTVVDAEFGKYTVSVLEKMKRDHEAKGLVEINPALSSAAQGLIKKYESIVIINSGGNVAYQSPGAIQTQTLNLETTKKTIRINPPGDAIGAFAELASYIEYLIGKFQDYQKQDVTKEGPGKYTIIYNAIRREYGSKWQTIPVGKFEDLMSFLQGRIDNSKVGRIRKGRRQKRYHSFEEHCRGNDD
jgi:hypothetical protein